MRSRRPRKRRPTPPVAPARLLTPRDVSPVAPGVGADGQPTTFHAPPWLATYGFWNTWQACGMFAATALRELDGALGNAFPWVDDPEPGMEEDRQLLGMQMQVAAGAIPALAQAQVITIPPGELDGLRPVDEARFLSLTRDEPLVHSPIYLDFCCEKTHVAALSLGDDGLPWGLGGVLIGRFDERLEVTLFGSPPAPDDGPLAQPLGRVSYVTGEQMPERPNPGEVLVDTRTWRSYMPTISQRSRIHARLRAVSYFAGPALQLLAYVQDAQLISETRNPKARAQFTAAGQRIALTPDTRER